MVEQAFLVLAKYKNAACFAFSCLDSFPEGKATNDAVPFGSYHIYDLIFLFSSFPEVCKPMSRKCLTPDTLEVCPDTLLGGFAPVPAGIARIVAVWTTGATPTFARSRIERIPRATKSSARHSRPFAFGLYPRHVHDGGRPGLTW